MAQWSKQDATGYELPEFEIEDPVFIVIVPADGVKVPVLVNVPPTVAVCVPVESVPLIFRLP